MRKLRIRWFLLGFASCILFVITFLGYTIFYSDNSFQVDLHTNSIALPTGEILVYTHDSCTETEINTGEHLLTLIKNNGTWQSYLLDATFSDFPKFILATSNDKHLVWAIDPVNQNWVEWNITTNTITEHINESPPEFDRSNRYVKIIKS